MRSSNNFIWIAALAALSSVACGEDRDSHPEDATDVHPSIPSDSPSLESTDLTEGWTGGDSTVTTSSDSTATNSSTSDTASTPGSNGDTTVECRGVVYQCGDGIDNDGDGHIDGADGECIGACDDDEASFATGLPGDNMDCKQDCFFDGNSGSGDDGCNWDLRCDPANPGQGTSCAFAESNHCKDAQGPSQSCLDHCLPYVPNGCDCFGCCEVQTDQGSVMVFLGSGNGCSLDNLDACQSCTFNTDCSNPCEAKACEVCLGGLLVPVECGDDTDTTGTDATGTDTPQNDRCPDERTPCEVQSQCIGGEYCLQGCCYPVPD